MGYAALAEVIGIHEPQDDSELIEISRHGLPGEVAEILADRLGISIGELCGLLHVSPKTITRYRGKVLGPNLSDRILTVAKVYARCKELFNTDENCITWLKSPILALGDARPIDLLDTGTGVNMVMTVLGRIEYGVYS